MTTISVEDVAALLGRDLTAVELTRAARLIGYAEGAVEDALPGFSIATGTEEVDVIVSGGALWTPRFPVTAITSLSVAGSTIDASAYRFTSKGRIDRVAHVATDFEVNPWTFGSSPVATVDYDFGTDPPPYSIVSAVAGAVAQIIQRQTTNTDGLLSRSESVDGYSYTDQYDREQARIATVSIDPTALRRWSRTRMVSVPLVSNG